MLRPLTLGLILAALGGCTDGGPDTGPYLAASIDGVAFRRPASDGVVVYSVDAPDGAGMVFSVASRRSIGGVEYLAIDLPNPPAVGTYHLGGDSATATYATCPTEALTDCASWTAIASDPGTLEIAAIDTASGSIEGTFAFHGHFLGDSAGAVKPVTEGRFRIRFTPAP